LAVRFGEPELDQVARQNQEEFSERNKPRLNGSPVLEFPVTDELIVSIGE